MTREERLRRLRRMHRLTHRLRNRLPVWVVYDRPLDYPQSWVSRLHLCLPTPRPTRMVIVADTREELRALLPRWLTRLDRMPDDEPQIVEIWL